MISKAYSRAMASSDSERPCVVGVGVGLWTLANVADEIDGVEVAFGEIVGVGVGVLDGVAVGGRAGKTLGVRVGVGLWTLANVADEIDGVEVAFGDIVGVDVGVLDGVGVETKTTVGESFWNRERHSSRKSWDKSGSAALMKR